MNVEFFVENVNQFSVAVGLLIVLILLVRNIFKKNTVDMKKFISTAMASCMIPTALALFFCAFDPDLVKKMTGMEINFFVAGLCIMYIAVATIKDEW